MIIKCQICGKKYAFEQDKQDKLPDFFPFCSKRCQLQDLGRWFDEDYRVEQDNSFSDKDSWDNNS